MPCRTDLFPCSHCGGEHYYLNECLSDPSKCGEGRLGYNPEIAKVAGQKVIDERQKAFNVEGALCDVLSLLEDKDMLQAACIPRDILYWWNNHQSKEQKKIKKEALAKLSAKEKRALGLK